MIEDAIAQAERYVRIAEKNVAQVAIVIERLDAPKHARAAAIATEVLATLQHSLDLAHQFLHQVRSLQSRQATSPAGQVNPAA